MHFSSFPWVLYAPHPLYLVNLDLIIIISYLVKRRLANYKTPNYEVIRSPLLILL